MSFKNILAITVLMAALLSTSAYLTKPSTEDCRKLGTEFVAKYIHRSTPGDGMQPSTNAGAGDAQSLSVEDRVLYKVIRYTAYGKTAQIGWGAFNRIQVSNGRTTVAVSNN